MNCPLVYTIIRVSEEFILSNRIKLVLFSWQSAFCILEFIPEEVLTMYCVIISYG